MIDETRLLPDALLGERAEGGGPEMQATLDAVTQLFLDSVAGDLPRLTSRPSDARAFLTRVQSAPVGKPSASIQDLTFPAGPTGKVRVRIVRPKDIPDVLPVVVHFHGGGCTRGDKNTHDRLIREIAVGAGAALLFVDYDRSPEARFPVAIEQAYAATKYVVDHAPELNIDGTRLAVLGDGVGGNMAAVVALMAKERRGPNIDVQILLYPVTDADLHTGSYRLFANGPWLTRQMMQSFWDAYLPDVRGRRAITATPLNASIDELRDLPDALIVVAENDVLRDEGEAYARKLSDAGVRVTSVRYNGAIHDFVLLNALADTPAVRGAIAQTVCFLKSAFG
jgi:acetyl esterase